jgi:hypothetical protein
MSYKLQWVSENRLSYVHVWGDYNLQELKDSSEEVQAWVANGTPLVHHIADFRDMETYPTNLAQILKSVPFMQEPNLGWVIILSDNRMVKFLSSMATGVSKARFRTFSNLEDALVFLAERDSTLPDLTGIEEASLLK